MIQIQIQIDIVGEVSRGKWRSGVRGGGSGRENKERNNRTEGTEHLVFSIHI